MYLCNSAYLVFFNQSFSFTCYGLDYLCTFEAILKNGIYQHSVISKTYSQMLCPFKFRSDVKIRISTKRIISFYKSKEIYSQKNTIPQVFKQIDNRTKKKNRSDDDRLLK